MHGAMRNRHAPFGEDASGRAAERIARFFGTPGYLAAQSAVVAAWIAFNAVAVGLAQTRQARRERASGLGERAGCDTARRPSPVHFTPTRR
jgi:uncharacterized membrane protein